MPTQNVVLLRMAGRLVDVSGRSGQTHFEEEIRSAWTAALVDIPRRLAEDTGLAERFAAQLALAASKPQHATMLFAMVDQAGKDTIVGEFFQNAEIEQLALLGGSNPDILRLLARVSGGGADEAEQNLAAAPLVEFGLASVAVPAGEAAAGGAVVTETHVFPGAWEGPESPGVLRDLVRIHEALTRTGARKPLERYGQPQIELWLASHGTAPQLKAAVPAVPEAPAAPAPAAVVEPVPVKIATPAPSIAAVNPPIPVPRPAAPAPKQTAPVQEMASYPFRSELAPSGNRTILLSAAAGLIVAIGAGVYFLSSTGKPGAAAPMVSAPVPEAAAPAESPVPAPVKRNPTQNARSAPASAGPSAAVAATAAPLSPKPAISTAAPAPTPAAQVPPAVPPAAQAAETNPAPSAETGSRRAAALDALGLPGQETEEKRRNALRALTGQ